MRRREFLGMAAWLSMAGVATTATMTSAATRASDRTSRRIAVIGAGLSGLAAAQQLRATGHTVEVIEARDRIGGRIWTSTRWPDLPVDCGASWIHGVKGNPLTAIADRIGARRLTTEYARSIAYDTSGEAFDDAAEKRLERMRDLLHDSIARAQSRDDDRSIRQALTAGTRRTLTPQERRDLAFLMAGEIEAEYAGSVDTLSAHAYDASEGFPGDDVIFADGYRVIVEHLARDLRIHTRRVVREIHWAASPVRIVTDDGEFTADQVLVTLPLGVLQAGDVRFVPALPTAKRDAIAGLGMGVLDKCYLRFPEVFWPDDVDWIEYVPETHGAWVEWVSFARVAGKPVLMGFSAADRAREIETWSDRRIVDDAMRTLRTIYGDEIPAPVDWQSTRWASDPFARGSYSCNPVGATRAMRAALAKPLDNRLFFAGEATGLDHFSTAHAAYLSGLRAAREMRG